MKRLALILATAVALSLPAASAQAVATTSAAPCRVNVSAPHGPYSGIVLSASNCSSPPLATVQAWLAPSADGRPLAEQQLLLTAFAGPVPPTGVLVTVSLPVDHQDCYAQFDVAYGAPKTDLLTPYGANLITAWHSGVRNCLWVPPSETPPASVTPSISESPTPSVPQPTDSASTPAPSVTPSTTTAVLPTRTIQLTTTPAPTTTKATIKPTPKPTKSRHVVVPPPPSASGCIGTGCDTPTPSPTSPVPTLPFTGPSHIGQLLTLGCSALVSGLGMLTFLALRRRSS